jgi:hypothetical protein
MPGGKYYGKHMTHFGLKKWYLDVTDDRGNVYIGYWLLLKWKDYQISCFQHLRHTHQIGVKTQSGIAKQPVPFWKTKNQLIWNTSQIRGSWLSLASGLKETLLHTQQGEICWHCTQPKAEANILLSGLSVKGWGYTECIDITIPVWKLPFTALYWGRCHTKNHYLVWIQWEGETKKSLLWHNGMVQEGAIISDTLIEGNDICLELPKDVILRQGNPLSTVLQPFSDIVYFIPETALMLDESKWYGNSTLKAKNSCEPATVIFEKVLW